MGHQFQKKNENKKRHPSLNPEICVQRTPLNELKSEVLMMELFVLHARSSSESNIFYVFEDIGGKRKRKRKRKKKKRRRRRRSIGLHIEGKGC